MKLNRTPNPLDRNARNGENDNWDIIEGEVRALGDRVDNFVEEVSDAALDKVVDNAKLNWKEPVDSFEHLPISANKGDTRMDKSTGKVFRYDGTGWKEIQQIDAGPVNELDSRLTSRLAETEKHSFYNSTISHKQPRFMVTIIDDDGHRGFYTKYFELAKEYNIPITSAMITHRAMGFPWDERPYNDRYYHYDEIIEMRDSGLIEFVSHTHNHNYNHQPKDMSEEELFDDFKTSQEIMKRLGLNHRGVVQPFGSYNDKVLNVARQVFEYSIGRRRPNDASNVIAPPVDNYDISRLSIEQHSFTRIKQDIDDAKEKNGWLVFVSHVDQAYGWTEEKTRQVIEYVLLQGGKFVTTQEGINHHGNILQAGDISISANGQVFGDKLGFTVLDRGTDTNNNTDLSEFAEGRITYSVIRSFQLNGFPGYANSGILITHHISPNEDWWNYQIFKPTYNGDKYIRYYRDGEWEDWRVMDNTLRQVNAFTGESLITNFPVGVTTFIVQGGNNFPEGLPFGSGGTITTVRPSETEHAWSYQIFNKYDSSDRYIRYATINGGWSRWELDGIKIAKLNEYDATNLIEDFPNGITMFRLQGSHNSQGLPSSSGGTFITYKPADLGWNYQEFVEYNSPNKYIRHVNTDGSWSEWRRFVTESV